MGKTLADYNLPLANCTFFLQNDEWKPCGIDTKFSERHRSTMDGLVITANVIAAVEGRQAIAWSKPTYLLRAVSDDGKIEPIDLTYVGEVLNAAVLDSAASQAGAIGINQKLVDRKPDPRVWTPNLELEEKLFRTASTLIEQKIEGKRVAGVRFIS